jgi:mono/diheme cytochrome c family protein
VPVGGEDPAATCHTVPERSPHADKERTMAAEVRGVVAMAKGEPVQVVTIVVPDPGPGEAVVRVQACGVCHTDLHYREGGINDEFPFLLGHEAASWRRWDPT